LLDVEKSQESGFFRPENVVQDAVMIELEICVDSVESAIAAEIGGAQRVELCSALSEGGLTPSSGMIRAVRSQIGIGVYVIIRPRSGDFFYSEDEWNVMQEDIAHAAECGADGVVFGLLTADGDVDVERTRKLVELARPMQVTFHRAIDMAKNLQQSLEAVIKTGADRVLTSGGAQSAMEGSGSIHELVKIAGDRIRVMVCGGVRAANVQQIAVATGATEFHASLRVTVPSPVAILNATLHLGDANGDEYARHAVLAEDVRAMREAIDEVREAGVRTWV
jgi:copper homeostasis protein